jgi:multidrug efflux pump subunit AcrA (membrane-fusion protein)
MRTLVNALRSAANWLADCGKREKAAPPKVIPAPPKQISLSKVPVSVAVSATGEITRVSILVPVMLLEGERSTTHMIPHERIFAPREAKKETR